MGCCLSKKPSSSPPPSSNGISCAVQSPDPIKPIKPVIEPIQEPKPQPKPEKLNQEDDTKKEVLVIKHRRSHEERSKKTNSDKASISPVSSPVAAEKPNVRISSCTKEEVDAILIQCGKLSRNNSAAKTRRYSGSKRSFDFDQNEKIRGGDAEEEEEEEARQHRHHRVNSSPRERRRRTPSREREDSKNHRSGSRERGNNGGGSRRVSRSPAKRTELPNPNSNGSSVNSNNNRPRKFVTVPATEKTNNVELSNKRITVKRNIGEACRIAASPRSKSPARAASNTHPPPSLSRSNSRKASEQSPYRRNPLGEIDQNSTKLGSCNIKKMIRASSPSRATTIVELMKPSQVVLSRSRSLRKSRDFDLVSNEDKNYTALLLKDIQNFHGKSGDDEDEAEMKLPLCVSKACSIVEAVADLNLNSESSQFRFTSTVKKADLMEPSFEKYVTVKRGGGSLEAQESCGSNNLIM